jgi:endoglucanase
MKTKTLIQRLFAQPTAPFRENWVLNEISNILSEHRIPYFHDSVGNLIAGARTPSALGKTSRLALQAHTDHPGFHLTERLDDRRWRALWFGGAPFKTMKGCRLAVYDPARPGFVATARCERVQTNDYSREGMPLVIRLDRADSELNKNCFGAFAFTACEIKGDQIRARVADDLAGVAIALGALLDQRHRGLAIFTRAEEVGFVGCMRLLESRILPRSTWLLCLEASRELPLAHMGEGPVLRLGDRSTVYNSDFSVWMWKVAEQLKKQKPKFQFQRRLMDGGSCEATAMSLYGYTTSGMAVPLRNYHNQGTNRPQPEIISLHDVENARQFCGELYRQFSQRPRQNTELQKSLHKNYRNLTPLLRARIPFTLENEA